MNAQVDSTSDARTVNNVAQKAVARLIRGRA